MSAERGGEGGRGGLLSRDADEKKKEGLQVFKCGWRRGELLSRDAVAVGGCKLFLYPAREKYIYQDVIFFSYMSKLRVHICITLQSYTASWISSSCVKAIDSTPTYVPLRIALSNHFFGRGLAHNLSPSFSRIFFDIHRRASLWEKDI